MSEYISIGEVLGLASKASECSLRQVPRKKIMFQGRKRNGETVTFCSPLAKKQPQGFYWVDITQEQARVLDETDKGVLFFRLAGNNLMLVGWSDLKQYLTPECMRYNANEGNHWKLYIYKDHIKVSGNTNEMPAELYHYAPAE